MRKYLTLTVAAAMVFGLAGMAQAAPITVENFSFEDPLVGAAIGYTPPGWSNGGSGNHGMFNLGAIAPTYIVPNQTDGSQIAYINPGSALYQTIAAGTYTMTAGDVITLQVDIGWSTGEASGAAGTIALYKDAPTASDVNGYPIITNSVAANSFDDASGGEWTTYTVTYTATEADAGQQIGIWLTTNSYQELYDNVRLSVTPVPEPATMALLGMGGLGLLLRRRNK